MTSILFLTGSSSILNISQNRLTGLGTIRKRPAETKLKFYKVPVRT